MFLWQKRATERWLSANEEALQIRVGHRLTVVQRPGQRSATLEVVCPKKEAAQLAHDFGGKIEKIPRNWLALCEEARERPALRIGRRLIVISEARSPNSAAREMARLVIPEGMAFGTGDHATTAMSLRLLERMTRPMAEGWSFVDLGTGSGILALAARCFGAHEVVGIDNDPIAVATARANARINRIDRIDFKVADVRTWRARGKVNVVAANLYSELLIETLPRLRQYLAEGARLILSGVMRTQELEVTRALRASAIRIDEIRRRGKWIALACNNRPAAGSHLR